jgi:hypothetical protein
MTHESKTTTPVDGEDWKKAFQEKTIECRELRLNLKAARDVLFSHGYGTDWLDAALERKYG